MEVVYVKSDFIHFRKKKYCISRHITDYQFKQDFSFQLFSSLWKPFSCSTSYQLFFIPCTISLHNILQYFLTAQTRSYPYCNHALLVPRQTASQTDRATRRTSCRCHLRGVCVFYLVVPYRKRAMLVLSRLHIYNCLIFP